MRDFFTSQVGVSAVLAFVVLNVLLGAVAYCIYFERKISAWIQDRYGPNRVGPWGLLQPIADGIKFLLKEDVVPNHVDKPLFILAPAVIFLVAFIGFAAIPWGGQLELDGRLVDIQVANPDIGLLYMLGVASMGVYGVVLGGWASNNKYSLYGAIRATAQMLSYEIPMGLCILVVVLTMGSLRLEAITLQQTGYWAGLVPQWNIFLHPLAFLILFITALAESNRTPFDLAEAEQELVGGYHTEYSALKFGMFFLAEYAHMITVSALIIVLFLGGWHLPWVSWTQPDATQWYAVLAKVGVLSLKIVVFLFMMMWIRWTLPRFRFDQLMHLAWKGLIPVTLALFALATILVFLGRQRSPLWALGGNLIILVVALLAASCSRRHVTGRQINLPAVAHTSDLIRGRGAEDIHVIPEAEVLRIDEPHLSASERLYLPQIVDGMKTTLRHLGRSLFKTKTRFTVQYPEQSRDLRLQNYRGVHRLNRDEQGRVACVACYMCSTACPAHCIHIEASESPWPDREKYPAKFDIDELRCIYCGMCEEACPVDAIELTPQFDLVGRTRQEMILDKEELLAVFDETAAMKPRKNPRVTGYSGTGNRPPEPQPPAGATGQ